MNALTPFTKLLTSGTMLRDILTDVSSPEILIYPSETELCFSDITSAIKQKQQNAEFEQPAIVGPLTTAFGNPVKMPCDITQAPEFFSAYLESNGVANYPSFHFLVDAPISLYAWKFSPQHKNVAALQLDLDKKAQTIIQRAPEGRRWTILSPKLQPYGKLDTPDMALITGTPKDLVESLHTWCREIHAQIECVYPISLLGLLYAMDRQTYPLEIYTFWGNNSKYSAIFHREKGLIFSEEETDIAVFNEDYVERQFAHLAEIANDLNMPLDSPKKLSFFPLQKPEYMPSHPCICQILTHNSEVDFSELTKTYLNHF